MAGRDLRGGDFHFEKRTRRTRKLLERDRWGGGDYDYKDTAA